MSEVLNSLIAVLQNPSESLTKKIRALFSLKAIGKDAVIPLTYCLANEQNTLLSHEIAYCLGQIGSKLALTALISVLNSSKYDPIVRHEAAEALGAIGAIEAIPILQLHSNNPISLISETCEIALSCIRESFETNIKTKGIYESVDPAPAESEPLSLSQLQTNLMNQDLDLYKRYKSMFSLRNMNTQESVYALANGFKDPSPLFRHEIAFVFGQMQNVSSIPFLISTLEDLNECDVCRHECAEALGSIATPECFKVLERFIDDEAKIVRDSCTVALDMIEYEKSDEFQYAFIPNTIKPLNVDR